MVDFLIWTGIALAFLLVGTVLFALTTKMSERKLILESDDWLVQLSVSLQLAGKVIGLIIVICSAAKYAIDINDYIKWGAIGVAAQIIGYFVLEFVVFPKVSLAKKVEKGNIGVAVMLFTFSLAIGMVISGCMSYDPVFELIGQ